MKPVLVIGATSLAGGFGVLGFLDARTPLPLIGAAMVLISAGVA